MLFSDSHFEVAGDVSIISLQALYLEIVRLNAKALIPLLVSTYGDGTQRFLVR